MITGTRAEFGLLLPLVKLLKKETSGIVLQIIATGAHLSPEFGLTYQEIEKAGFEINEKVEMLLSADSDTAIAKSVGLGIIGMTDALSRLKPNWVVLLGDRFEAFAAASAAYLQKIPIAHLHGGETTEGAMDEGFRHAITKLSYLHFTSTEIYRKRVIQMGESPDRVFNVGAIGLDNVFTMPLMNKQDLSLSLNFSLDRSYGLVTFHPATLENAKPQDQFQELLKALDSHPDLKLIFTFPNADAHGRSLIALIESYVEKNQHRAKAYVSLGQLRYLSAMKYAAVVIGNSSSGIIEAPSFGVPTVNIGDRQKGRIVSDSTINTTVNAAQISTAIKTALSPDFRAKHLQISNPYGNGGTAQKILGALKPFTNNELPAKQFYNC